MQNFSRAEFRPKNLQNSQLKSWRQDSAYVSALISTCRILQIFLQMFHAFFGRRWGGGVRGRPFDQNSACIILLRSRWNYACRIVWRLWRKLCMQTSAKKKTELCTLHYAENSAEILHAPTRICLNKASLKLDFRLPIQTWRGLTMHWCESEAIRRLLPRG